ncbi:MAG: glutamate 5-kinase [Mycobacteriales bacterium]
MMQPRKPIHTARRVVVKIGSSSLTSAGGSIDPVQIDALTDAIAQRHSHGVELILVSSGAVASGFASLGLRAKPRDAASKQASASVGQMLLVARYAASFARYNLVVGQVLLTAEDLLRRSQYRSAKRTFDRLLALKALPVVNENDTVATDENKFGDNDRLAALVAHVVHADALVLLSDVAGLYTDDPRRAGARLLEEVMNESDLTEVNVGSSGSSGLGSGGMASKLAAARIATAAGVHVVLASATHAHAVLTGEPVGTYFAPTGSRLPIRLLWLRHVATPAGRLVIDAGALRAVTHSRASLLAAGVTRLHGEFDAGDPVDVVGPDDVVVARGLVGYDSRVLPQLLGKSSHLPEATHQREVVHRDDLVLM